MERTRYKRDLSERWIERKLDAYMGYLSDVKEMRVIARRMLRDTGLDPALPISLSREEGLLLLAEAEAHRSVSAERVQLIGSEEIITALHALNKTVWRIEWFARGLIDNTDTDAWKQASSEYAIAINNFQELARSDLRVPGSYVPRDTGSYVPTETPP
jgi:hypothetical protein